jgi:hypothetical protein
VQSVVEGELWHVQTGRVPRGHRLVDWDFSEVLSLARQFHHVVNNISFVEAPSFAKGEERRTYINSLKSNLSGLGKGYQALVSLAQSQCYHYNTPQDPSVTLN